CALLRYCCPTGILQLLGSRPYWAATPGGSEPGMPKAAAYCLTWCPEHEAYELCESHNTQLQHVVLDGQAWFDLLAAPSFAFRGQAGQLTVRQEGRPHGGMYWYASRRTGKRMAKRYLGRATDLTLARLEEVAAQLTEAALCAGQGAVAHEASRAE